MYPQQAMFAVRRDSQIQQVRDLAGKRVVWGARSSGLIVLARYVMDGMGLDMQRDFDSVTTERAADGPPMVIRGEAAAMFGAGIGSPALEAVIAAPGGARLLVPAGADIQRIQQKHAFLKRVSVPAGSFAGQSQALDTIGSWAFVMCRADLPEATGWRVAAAAHRAREALAKQLPQATTSTLQNTVEAAPGQQYVQAGVARYARENGVRG
jgi:TRAP transporter TAXI family solute receptor